MRITCRCSSCGGTYQVDGQYAGRKIKCPKCAAAIVVTAAAEARASATTPPKAPKGPNPLRVAEKIEAETPAADEPEWSWSARATGSPEAPAVAEAEPEEAPEAGRLGRGGDPRAGGDRAEADSADCSKRKHHGKKKAGNSGLWIALGGLGVAALAIAGVFAGFDDDVLDEDGDAGRQTPTTIAGASTTATAGTPRWPWTPAPPKPSTRFDLDLAAGGAGGRRGDRSTATSGTCRRRARSSTRWKSATPRTRIHITRKGFRPLDYRGSRA